MSAQDDEQQQPGIGYVYMGKTTKKLGLTLT